MNREEYVSELTERGYRYDTEGLNLKSEPVICYRNIYTGHEIQIPKEDDTIENHDEKIRKEAIKKFLRVKNSEMSPKQFEEMMREFQSVDDEEERHMRMDELMCRLLDFWGYEDGVKIFRDTKKWYA